MTRILGADSVDAIKNIDGSYVVEGDLCIMLRDQGVFFYKLRDGATANEDIPYVIEPNTNADQKRWFILSITELTEDIKLSNDSTFEIENIKAGENGYINIYDNLDNRIAVIRDYKIEFFQPLVVDDINVSNINGHNTDMFVFKDGSRNFTNPIISPDPTYYGHLANKKYVDLHDQQIDDDLQSYKDFVDDNYAKWDNTEEHVPDHEYNPTTKKYVDDEIASYTSFVNELEKYYARWDNTDEQTPTHEYNPATKKYVDTYRWVDWHYIVQDEIANVHKGYFISAHDQNVTLLLPSDTAQLGDTIAITVIDLTYTVKIDRNGGKILGQEEDLYIDVSDSGITLTYSGAEYGWAIVSEISGVTPLDGDMIDITWNPQYYSPDDSSSEVDNVDDLSAHLKGIDNALVSSRTFLQEAEPSDPPDGQAIMYLSDGSASDENEGDLMLKVNVGGSVSKTTMVAY